MTDEHLALGLIYPPHSKIFDASMNVAIKVATTIFDRGLAGVARPDDVDAFIRSHAYRPVYQDGV